MSGSAGPQANSPSNQPPNQPPNSPSELPIKPRGLYRFLATLSAEVPHGTRFLYRSAESDVLGWVCERAAGQPMAQLLSELVWAPMGAEYDADLLHDGLGTAVHDGGLCATGRDGPGSVSCCLTGEWWEPAGSSRRSGCARPGPSTPIRAPCSPRPRLVRVSRWLVPEPVLVPPG